MKVLMSRFNILVFAGRNGVDYKNLIKNKKEKNP